LRFAFHLLSISRAPRYFTVAAARQSPEYLSQCRGRAKGRRSRLTQENNIANHRAFSELRNPMMRSLCLLCLLLFNASAAPAQEFGRHTSYRQFFPKGECHPEAFELARQGYNILLRDSLLRAPRYLTIIDYSKPSDRQRLFVLDVPGRRLVLSSIVAHGIGSDPDSAGIPYRFGNRNNSRMSSIGFYLTGDVYFNHRPDDSLGLCLFGLDRGYNDSAAAREIVLHYGATEYRGKVYVTDSGAARSYGCPALPLSTNSRVIGMIRGGSLLFIYSAREAAQYRRRSAVLNHNIRLPLIQQGPPPNNCYCNLQQRK
jgi:hypothetical protein